MDVHALINPKNLESKQVLQNSFGQPIGKTVANYTPCVNPRDFPHQVLKGKYVYLERLNVDKHLNILWDIFEKLPDSFYTYLSEGPYRTKEQYKAAMEEWVETKTEQRYAIFDNSTHQVLGTIGLIRVDVKNHAIETGPVWFTPLIAKKRTGTDAVYTLMKFAFIDLKYKRLEWKCDALNIPSRLAALRYGFTLEGVFRKARIYNGARSRDTSWYSLTDDEFFGFLQAAYEEYLNETNFMNDGTYQQIKKLADIITPHRIKYETLNQKQIPALL